MNTLWCRPIPYRTILVLSHPNPVYGTVSLGFVFQRRNNQKPLQPNTPSDTSSNYSVANDTDISWHLRMKKTATKLKVICGYSCICPCIFIIPLLFVRQMSKRIHCVCAMANKRETVQYYVPCDYICITLPAYTNTHAFTFARWHTRLLHVHTNARAQHAQLHNSPIQ